MRYGSVCSGIEAASVAWRHLDWSPAWFAEIDPFCCELLNHRFPGVPNFGNIAKVSVAPSIDLLVGGTPCQSFSINGHRKGLDDPRGQLTYEFGRIARKLRPTWIVWENVPNVLQVDKGRAFGAFVRLLAECGYHLAYRVMDLRFFGIPQRRRRLFVVGHLGDWRRAAGVLFDAPTCEESNPKAEESRMPVSKQASLQFAAEPCLGFTGDTTPKFAIDCTPTLRSLQGGEGVGILDHKRFRRLTIIEQERLMGFPDGYTDVLFRGKMAGTSVRRRAIGNSFPVPIVRWIGERIAKIETISYASNDCLGESTSLKYSV